MANAIVETELKVTLILSEAEAVYVKQLLQREEICHVEGQEFTLQERANDEHCAQILYALKDITV